MCSKEEVQEIVSNSETRQRDYTDKSHMALSSTISNFFGEIKEDIKILDEKMTLSVIDRNSIHDTLAGLHKTTSETLEQARKTNGRVTKAETWIEKHGVEYTNLCEKIEKVNNTILRLNWIVITAVVGSIVALVIK